MATVTKKVYPLGGGDYTSVSAALSLAPHTAGDDLVLLCGPGNIGGFSSSGMDYGTVTVVADSGFKHNGTTASVTSAVASITSLNIVVDDTGPALTVDGIYFVRLAAVLIEAYNNGTGGTTNLTIKNCLIKYATTSANNTAILADPDGSTTNLTVVNTLFYINATSSGFLAIAASPGGAISGATVNLDVDFNSGANTATTANVSSFVFANSAADASGGSTVNVTCRNNGFCNSAADFKKGSALGTVNLIAAGHNVSADATATVFGGVGNLTSKSAATCFKTPASDLHMATGSPLLAAGVAIGGITKDNQGNVRPTPPSSGALDVVTLSKSRASAGDLGILGNGD